MKHRLFIAINLPANLKSKLNELILRLQKINKRNPIKWVNSNQLHLTLHFLGYIDKQQIPEIEKILEKVTAIHKPFVMKIGDIDGFPNRNNSKVIFIDCHEIDTKIAQSIQKTTGVELKRADFNVESRPWHEHITLARVKNKCRPKLPHVEISEGKFKVESIELIESRLTPSEAKYKIVKSFPL